MLGLISLGPQGDAEAQERRAEMVPATTGEVFGGAIAEGFQESVGPRMARIAGRGYIDQGDGNYAPLAPGQTPFDDFSPSLPGQLISAFRRAFPGEQPLPPSPMVPLDVLKREYEIPGVLSFDKDTPQSVAQSLYEHKRDQMARADAVRRADNMLTQGMAARFVGGMIGSLADPVNIAAMFVPGLRETTVARMMGVGPGASALARAGVRAGAGASAGAAGMIALEPLNAVLMAQERDDWTMAGALANVLFGTVAGAGFHSGLGALAERTRGLPEWAPARVFSEQMQNAAPEVQDALVRSTMASTIEGRPVVADELLAVYRNLDAARNLRALAEAQARYEADAQAALRGAAALRDRAARPSTRQEAAAAFGGRATDLRAEAQGLETDMARVQERATVEAMDAMTVARLEAVDAELGGVIPAARRRALSAERLGLMEGRGALDRADALTEGRNAAELRGLKAALDRAVAGAEKAEAGMALAAREAETEAAKRAALAQRAGAVERASLAQLAARSAMVDANAARAVRQIAGAMDARLLPKEAQELGSALVRGHIGLDDALLAIERWKGDNARVTPETLASIGEDASTFAARVAGALDTDAKAAMTNLEAAQRPNPADAVPPPAVTRTGAAPPDPKPPGEIGAVAKDIAEIEKQTADLDALLKVQGDERLAQRIKDYDALVDEETKIGTALYDAVAACIVRTR